MNLFELTKAVYLKQPVPTTNWRMVCSAQRIAAKLPKDLKFDPGLQQYERAFRKLNNRDTTKVIHHEYSDIELQNALQANILDGMTYSFCSERHGVPESTLKRHILALAKEFSCSTRKELIDFRSCSLENDTSVRKAIMCIVVPKTGPPPMLSKVETDLLLVIASKKNAAGVNQGKRDIAQSARELCKAKALEMEEGPEKDRLQNAVCVPKYIRKIVADITPCLKQKEKETCKPGFRKNSAISAKRAEAANPMLHCVMLGKIDVWYEDLRRKGVPIPPEGPPTNQKWNGDEKGFTTNSKFPPSFSMLNNIVRNFTIVSGEKSTFWTTMFYWICGDGEVPVAPIVVHQGGSDTEMPAKFLYGLPENWSVHNTSSGYMDKSGFYICVEALVLHIRNRDGNNDQHQFVFLDGHDSHWDVSALELAEENNIHIFFLKSNDSINDQPADMGANAMLEKYYQAAMAAWRRRFVSTKFNPMFMNEVLVTAFNEFLRDKKV